MKPKKRALITGATGYLGSNLVRHLANEGWEISVIQRSTPLNAGVNHDGSIKYYQHDGTSAGMLHIMQDAAPDVVFHLASLFVAQHTTQNLSELLTSNILFSTQVVDSMSKTGVRHLVNTGTSWQHFNNQKYNPVNLYSASKQAFETILTYYVEAGFLKATTLILFDTYGPSDPRSKLISILWSAAKTEVTLEMSPGDQLVDLVHVNDVMRAYAIAAELIEFQKEGHVRYAVSSGQPVKLKELVRNFEMATGLKVPVNFGGRPYREREVMVPWTDYDTLPGWVATVPFNEGILQTSPDYRA